MLKAGLPCRIFRKLECLCGKTGTYFLFYYCFEVLFLVLFKGGFRMSSIPGAYGAYGVVFLRRGGVVGTLTHRWGLNVFNSARLERCGTAQR